MSSSQLKRAEHAIEQVRSNGCMPPEAIDALTEIVDLVRSIESRVSVLETSSPKPPTSQMDLPNRT
jgi:hypothetical protein